MLDPEWDLTSQARAGGAHALALARGRERLLTARWELVRRIRNSYQV